MPTDPTRTQAVFAAAAQIADPAARNQYLVEACAGDAELKARVEALLRAHEQPDSLLDVPLIAPRDSEHAPTRTYSPDPLHADTRTGGGTSRRDDEIPLGFLSPPTRPDSLGRIGHYEVLQVLGQGGFGIVFRAFDDVLQRVVAVKVLAPQLAATSPARKRFLREARTSGAIRHENVVQVYEVGEEPLPFLVMEFIPGETLQQRLDRMGPVEPAEVVRVGRQIAEGLTAAHATDLIHRDIKPGNVLLEGSQQKVKITDFGLARAADDASISQSGIIAGTPMYMAPEQALGHKLDQRADLFSLGSVLYQMATGRPPFRANSTVAVLKRVADDTPRDIREIVPETPQWLCDIIAKLHAKNPDERFQSAREVADVLADCEAQLKESSKLKDFSRIPRSKAPRRGRRKWVAAVAVLLLPVLALAVTETAGVTHLFRPTNDSVTPGNEPTLLNPQLASAPFDATQARAHQDAWAKHLGVEVEITNTIGMKLRLIPPGEFTMGSTYAEVEEYVLADRNREQDLRSEAPPRRARVDKPFYLATYETTRAQFKKFVQATGYRTTAETNGKGGYDWNPDALKWERRPEYTWRRVPDGATDQHPIGMLSLADAQAFCRWLSAADGHTYVIPSEVQWEYACRAGTDTPWPCPRAELGRFAWYRTNSNSTFQPVGAKAPNAFDLFDMLGNGEEIALTTDGNQAIRGGFPNNADILVRPAARCVRSDEYLGVAWGFRVAIVGDLKGNTQPVATDSPTDLIPFARPDLSGGRWESHDGKLVHPARDSEDYPGLALAVRAPDDFDLEAEFERTSGDEFIAFGMSSRGHLFCVALDTWKQWAGLQAVAGELLNVNPTRRMGPWLTNDRRHKFRCEVRSSGVRAWLDEREVVDYRGGYEALGYGPPGLPDWAQFFVQANDNSGFVVHKLVLIPRPAGAPHANPEPSPPTFKNNLGMEFVKVPKGKSWLGGGKDKLGDKEVEVPADFYLGKYEVTQEEWTQVMGTNPSQFSRTGAGKDAVKDISDADLKRYPVENVSWEQCQVFAAKLNTLAKESGWVYRLPTATEWEYACRGGPMADKADSAFDYYYEKPAIELKPTQANFNESWMRTCKVGSYEPNRLGLHDLHGNVNEWCSDQGPAPKSDEKNACWADFKGGRWNAKPENCRASTIGANPPSSRSNGVGLRLARVPAGAPSPQAKTPPDMKPDLLPPSFKNNLGMEFVRVPKGKSWLGGGKDKLGDKEVEITTDFYLGKYEVTQEEWTQVMGENPSHFSRSGEGKDAVKDIPDAVLKRFPVERVSWDQCQVFIAKLNKMEKEAGWVYRLPTEVEWEYACRGGPMADKADSAFDFYFAEPANTLLPDQANLGKDKGMNRTCKVGSFQPNRLGLFAMHGNAWEWCNDPEIAIDGVGLRVLRGGAWSKDLDSCRAGFRDICPAGDQLQDIGLRLARVPVGAVSEPK